MTQIELVFTDRNYHNFAQYYLWSLPGIDDGSTCFVIMAPVSRDHREAIIDGCRRNHEVRLGERMSDFSSFFDKFSPFQQNVFGYLQNSSVEHGPDVIHQPLVECGTSGKVGDALNAKPKLSESYRTQVNLSKGKRGNESHNTASGLGLRSSDKTFVSTSHAIKK